MQLHFLPDTGQISLPHPEQWAEVIASVADVDHLVECLLASMRCKPSVQLVTLAHVGQASDLAAVLLCVGGEAAANVEPVAVPLCRVRDDLVEKGGEAVFLSSAIFFSCSGLRTSKIVLMYTSLEFERHRKVVSPRFCSSVTARFMAGCWCQLSSDRTYDRQLAERVEHLLALVSCRVEVGHSLVAGINLPTSHCSAGTIDVPGITTYTTSGIHCEPALLRSCRRRRSLVSRTSKTQRSVSWSTKDQSKSKITRFLGIVSDVLTRLGRFGKVRTLLESISDEFPTS